VTFLPALHLALGGARERPRVPASLVTRPLSTLERLWPARRVSALRRPIFALSLALTAAAAFGVSRLSVESHVLSFFPDTHPLVKAQRRIERDVIGLTPVEIWVRGPRERVLADESIETFRRLAAACLTEADVTAVLSPFDMGLFRGRPATDVGSLIEIALGSSSGLPEALAERLRVSPDGTTELRLTVTVRTGSSESCAALVDRLEPLVAATVPPGTTARVTGAIPLLVRLQVLILTTQVKTFALSLVTVSALLALAFRSLKVALLGLVPNLLPVAATLGAMGFLGIPLDVATVTVASIAMGLVVDSTIHIVLRFTRATGAGRSGIEALDETFRAAGRPMVFSSLALSVGFAAFVAAGFRPTHDFGLLVGLTALSALAFDLTLTPALLLTVRP
jgi:hypothetical protein